MEYEVKGAIDRNRWRKEIRDDLGMSGKMFLLVPAHLSCPGQNPESGKMVVCL